MKLQPFDQRILDLLLHRCPPPQTYCARPDALAAIAGASPNALRAALRVLAHIGHVHAESCQCNAHAGAHLRISVHRQPRPPRPAPPPRGRGGPAGVFRLRGGHEDASAANQAGTQTTTNPEPGLQQTSDTVLQWLAAQTQGRASCCVNARAASQTLHGDVKAVLQQLRGRGLVTFGPCSCPAVARRHTRVHLLPPSGHVVTDFSEPPAQSPRAAGSTPDKVLQWLLAQVQGRAFACCNVRSASAKLQCDATYGLQALEARGFVAYRKCRCRAVRGLHSRVHLLPASGHVVTDTSPPPVAQTAAGPTRRRVRAVDAVLTWLSAQAQGRAWCCFDEPAASKALKRGVKQGIKRLRTRGFVTFARCSCPAIAGAHTFVRLLPASGHVVTDYSEAPAKRPVPRRKSRRAPVAVGSILPWIVALAQGRAFACFSRRAASQTLQCDVMYGLRLMKERGLLTHGKCTCPATARPHTRVHLLPASGQVVTDFSEPPDQEAIAPGQPRAASAVAKVLPWLVAQAQGRAFACFSRRAASKTLRCDVKASLNTLRVHGLVTFGECSCAAVAGKHTRVDLLPASGHVVTDFSAPPDHPDMPRASLTASKILQWLVAQAHGRAGCCVNIHAASRTLQCDATWALRTLQARDLVTFGACRCQAAAGKHTRVHLLPASGHVVTDFSEPPAREPTSQPTADAVLRWLAEQTQGRACCCVNVHAASKTLNLSITSSLNRLRTRGLVARARCVCPAMAQPHTRVHLLPASGHVVTDFSEPPVADPSVLPALRMAPATEAVLRWLVALAQGRASACFNKGAETNATHRDLKGSLALLRTRGLVTHARCLCPRVAGMHTRVDLLPASGHVVTDFSEPPARDATSLREPVDAVLQWLLAQAQGRASACFKRKAAARTLHRDMKWSLKVLSDHGIVASGKCTCAAVAGMHTRVDLLPASGHVVTDFSEPPAQKPTSEPTAEAVLPWLMAQAQGRAFACFNRSAASKTLHRDMKGRLKALRDHGLVAYGKCLCAAVAGLHTRVDLLPASGHVVTDFSEPPAQTATQAARAHGPSRVDTLASRVLAALCQYRDRELTTRELAEEARAPASSQRFVRATATKLLQAGLVEATRDEGRLYWAISAKGLAANFGSAV